MGEKAVFLKPLPPSHPPDPSPSLLVARNQYRSYDITSDILKLRSRVDFYFYEWAIISSDQELLRVVILYGMYLYFSMLYKDFRTLLIVFCRMLYC